MSKKTILFFRDGFFYPTEYPRTYKNWAAEAERNPGTTRIVDAETGRVLWLPAMDGDRP